jgi:hypothetical protein
MKTKYVIISLCLLCSSLSFAQQKLFDKYADMDNVTSVYISKAMFQMMPAMGDVGLNLMNMKGKVESLQVLTTERKDLAEQMRKEFTTLVSDQHQELMRVRDSGTRATFYSNMQGEKIKDLIMLADTEDGYTIIQLVGDFTLQDIQEITKEYE